MTDLARDPELDPTGDEVTLLHSFLEYQRTILIRKAEGVTDAQSRLRIEPSEMTLLGLIRHMAEVERSWFRRRFADVEAPPIYYSDSDPDGDFHPGDDDTLEEAIVTLRSEIEFAQSSTAGVPLDTLAKANPPTQRIPGWQPNLRWILIHLIEEYARHCGHADLLRQRVDGAVGD
ncbi:MAG: DinB family protein [Ilumatobacteraceae bacterium]